MTHNLSQYNGDPVENHFKNQIDFVAWWEFREKIRAGINVDLIKHYDRAQIKNDLKYEFTTFGRANYTIYNSIASAYINIQAIKNLQSADMLYTFQLKKLISETYYHFRVSLDNISRIIYVLYFNGSVKKKDIDSIDYGRLKGYLNNKVVTFSINEPPIIDEINELRHHLTHYWNTMQIIRNNGVFWPDIMRKKRGFIWWYEGDLIGMDNNYNRTDNSDFNLNVVMMVENDFEEIKKYLSVIYSKCANQIDKWLEKNNLTFQ